MLSRIFRRTKVIEKAIKDIHQDIKDIHYKRRFSTATIEDFTKDADKCTLDAAKKKDFQLLKRSNDIQSSIKTKEEELKELDKMEKSLYIRKENM